MLRIVTTDRIIIDATDFESSFQSTFPPFDLLPIKDQSKPIQVDKESVLIGGWRFNVKSTIFFEATASEIVSGWNLIDRNLSAYNTSMEKLFKPVFRSLIIDYNRMFGGSTSSATSLAQVDFTVLGLLRLCYWYYNCSSIQTFHIKENEIREKIRGALLMVENSSEAELQDKLDIFRNAIDDCSSEVMFASLATKVGTEVSFDGIHDLVINDIPAEVKTIHDKIVLKMDNEGNHYAMAKGEKFGEISLKAEIVEEVARKKWGDHIDRAICQGGLIIFVNATFTSVLQDYNAAQLIEENSDEFADILLTSVEKATTDDRTHLPVIVSVGAMYYDYQQSYFMVSVPVRMESGKLILDLQRFTKTDMPNNVSL